MNSRAKDELRQRRAKLSEAQRTLLARRLRPQSADQDSSDVMLSRPQNEVAPLSFAQQRLWFLQQLEPHSAAYNEPGAFHMRGKLDVPALAQALHEVERRHEVLRSTFHMSNGELSQIIHPSPKVVPPPSLVDLRARSLSKDEIRKRACEEAGRPFDLSRYPLWRANLLQVGDDEYVALLTMHHIVSDGWSMGVFVKELVTLYAAFLSGRPSPLPEPSLQYADYAYWERRWLQNDLLDEQLAYWKQALDGAPYILDLPTDHPRSDDQDNRAAQHAFLIPFYLSERLRSLSRQEGVTLFMTLLAAFSVLLYRYTEQEDILVGTPVAGRTRSDFEGLIGFFVKTLVMRADLSGNPSFGELLQRLRRGTLEAYAHQDLPFEKLVEELRPARDLKRTPLFQVMLAMQNFPVFTEDLYGLTITQFETQAVTPKFDLSLIVRENESGLQSSLEYSCDLFEASTIERMSNHFLRLLEGIADDSSRRLSELPLLSHSELKELGCDPTDALPNYPDACLQLLFEDQVQRSPDATSVVFKEKTLTYRELNRRANQLAHHLRSCGIGPEMRVGLCVERSLEMVVALMGILKAGAAYVPLDLLNPRSRLASMIEDASLSLLLTQSQLKSVLPEHNVRQVYLDLDWNEIGLQPDENPVPMGTGDNLAYVLYTSGSTGRPKGVLIPHCALVNHGLAMLDNYALGPSDRVLQFASFGFDVAAEEIFPTLLAGASVVLMPNQDFPSLLDFSKLLEKERLTVLNLPTPFWVEWMKDLSRSGARLPDDLRLVVAGSDTVLPTHFRMWRELADERVRWLNAYGLTETAITTTIWEPDPYLEELNGCVPIGRPIANAQVYVLDRHLNPMPVGVPGELMIGGACLARGYLNLPEMTSEAFIANPLAESAGARLFKTGDRGRYLSSGNIEFLGRIDDLIKVRGFRVDPSEIEVVLRQHSQISDAVVVAQKSPSGEQRLVVYLVASDEGSEALVKQLRSSLEEQLPPYLMPSSFVFLKAFPLTPSGKLDRRLLPPPGSSGPAMEREYVPARTSFEQELAAIWTEVLGLESVCIFDNFFDVGGYSLLGARVISRVREAFQVELPLRNIFEYPTVASLASSIEDAMREHKGSRLPPLQHVARDKPLPLSLLQQPLWEFVQVSPQTSFYNMADAVHLSGTLDIPALEQSFSEIVSRHEILRTNFVIDVDGQPVQVIHPAGPFSLPLFNLEHLPNDVRETQLSELAQACAHLPFDLASDSLLRAALVRLSEAEHVLLVTMHHIISDGWSIGVFSGEMISFYEAFSNGKPLSLPELPFQYADFAVWQRQWLREEGKVDYWRKQLAGSNPILNLPFDHERPNRRTFLYSRQYLVLGDSRLNGLKRVSRQEGVSPFMTLLAGLLTLLHLYTKQTDILIGTLTANRGFVETEKLIGFFINTIVLRNDLSGDPSFAELVQRVRRVALEAYAHQDLPFEQVWDVLRTEFGQRETPLFQILFIYQIAVAPLVQLPNITFKDFSINGKVDDKEMIPTTFDMIVEVEERPEQLTLVMKYNADLFEPETMNRMVKSLDGLLEVAVENPATRLSNFSVDSRSERQGNHVT
jgi:amino acid adenylation domain-containing protein